MAPAPIWELPATVVPAVTSAVLTKSVQGAPAPVRPDKPSVVATASIPIRITATADPAGMPVAPMKPARTGPVSAPMADRNAMAPVVREILPTAVVIPVPTPRPMPTIVDNAGMCVPLAKPVSVAPVPAARMAIVPLGRAVVVVCASTSKLTPTTVERVGTHVAWDKAAAMVPAPTWPRLTIVAPAATHVMPAPPVVVVPVSLAVPLAKPARTACA